MIVDDKERLHVALDSLPSKYDSFSSAIRTYSDFLSIEELNTLLIAKERTTKKGCSVIDASSMAMVANYQS